jgi:prefoldin subunit 5
VKKVTIEIGGNFFVETTIDKADKYCDRKLDAVKQSMTKIDDIIKNKSDQLNAINKFIIEKQTAPKK